MHVPTFDGNGEKKRGKGSAFRGLAVGLAGGFGLILLLGNLTTYDQTCRVIALSSLTVFLISLRISKLRRAGLFLLGMAVGGHFAPLSLLFLD